MDKFGERLLTEVLQGGMDTAHWPVWIQLGCAL